MKTPNTFRKMRGLPDRVLNQALVQHKAALEGAGVWASGVEKERKRLRILLLLLVLWNIILTFQVAVN